MSRLPTSGEGFQRAMSEDAWQRIVEKVGGGKTVPLVVFAHSMTGIRVAGGGFTLLTDEEKQALVAGLKKVVEMVEKS